MFLLLARRGRTPEDLIGAYLLIFYGLFRFAVTREPDAQLGFIAFGRLTMGQLLSVVLSLAGVLLWLGISIRRSRHTACISAAAPAANPSPSP